MLRITLRDLQWRRRRFAIATVGTALVFAMTLVLAGVSAAFRVEADRTLAGIGADAWVVPAGSTGPFGGLATLPQAQVAEVAREPGVRAADPIIVLHQAARAGGIKDITLIGYRPGGIGRPPLVDGRESVRAGEAVTDRSLGLSTGAGFTVGTRTYRVVGHTLHRTAYGGLPDVYVTVTEAQALTFGGQPLVGSVVTRGRPTMVPKGLVLMENHTVRDDILRPLGKAVQTIDLVQVLLWIVAACIIASVVYLSAMERVKDFAVLKATGASSRSLMTGLAVQSVLVSLAAALLSAVTAQGLARLFPLAVEVPVSAMLVMPLVALVVGLLASLSGAQRAVSVDPAMAFGGP
ncbi:MAG: ABC transporter permease [Candidatus Dormibacteria bacterium]